MKTHRRVIIPILVILVACLAACSPAGSVSTITPLPPTATLEPTGLPSPTAPPTLLPASREISVIDGLGREITLQQPAQHIISLAPSNTEILFAIGAGSQMIGRDSFSDFPAEAKTVQDIGGPSFGSNMELITQLQPDLILAAEINTPEQVAEFEKLGLTVFYLNNPKDLSGLFTNLEIAGRLTGHEQDAAQLCASLRERIAAIDNKIATIQTKPKVFYELDGTDPAKPWTTGPGSFMARMIELAGGINAGDSLPIQWAQISQEELIMQNPDLILLGDAKFGTTVEMVKQRAGWDAIKAVQNNNIVAFDDDLTSRPGPRLVDGLEALAKLIHPELLP